MKEKYEALEQLAREINKNWKEVGKDGMSIIVGVADCNEEMIRELVVTGHKTGLMHLISEILYGYSVGKVKESDDEPDESLN